MVFLRRALLAFIYGVHGRAHYGVPGHTGTELLDSRQEKYTQASQRAKRGQEWSKDSSYKTAEVSQPYVDSPFGGSSDDGHRNLFQLRKAAPIDFASRENMLKILEEDDVRVVTDGAGIIGAFTDIDGDNKNDYVLFDPSVSTKSAGSQKRQKNQNDGNMAKPRMLQQAPRQGPNIKSWSGSTRTDVANGHPSSTTAKHVQDESRESKKGGDLGVEPERMLLDVLCSSKNYEACRQLKLNVPLNLQDADYRLHSLTFLDLSRRNSNDLIALFRLNSSGAKNVSFDPRIYVLASYLFDVPTQDYVLVWSSSPDQPVSSLPIVVDINFNGLPDLLLQEATTDDRLIYMNLGMGIFTPQKWQDATEYIDQKSYSSLPRANFTGSEFLHSMKQQQQKQKAGQRNVLQNILHVFSWRQKNSRAKSALEKEADRLNFEEKYLHLHENEAHFLTWTPRPLPLKQPTPLAPISGHTVIDVDGDCISDLVLVVQSPDFPTRYELEVWLTESSPTGNFVRRMWRGQRLLLPAGSQAVKVADFSRRGGADLAVLACDLSTSEFARRDIENTLICDGAERLFLFKMFSPPLCSAPGEMPDFGLNNTCRDTNNLCVKMPFAFGGFDDGLRRLGMSISSLRAPEEEDVKLVGSSRLPVVIHAQDVDEDGFLDIALLTSNPLTLQTSYHILISTNAISSGAADQTTSKDFNMQVQAAWDKATNVQQAIRSAFHIAWQGILSIKDGMRKAFLPSSSVVANPLLARRFRSQYLLNAKTKATFYAGGFDDDDRDAVTYTNRRSSLFGHQCCDMQASVKMVAFSHDNGSTVMHDFRFSGERYSFAFACECTLLEVSTAARVAIKPSFFVDVIVADGFDESCLIATTKNVLPLLGTTTMIAQTGADGLKYAAKSGRHTPDATFALQPRQSHIG